MKEKRQRCTALVWHKDTYRRTGRGKSGFEMHYTKDQCSHAAVEYGRCKKHPRIRFPDDCIYYEFVG